LSKNCKRAAAQQPKIVVEPLEPRILFSADVVSASLTLDAIADNPEEQQNWLASIGQSESTVSTGKGGPFPTQASSLTQDSSATETPEQADSVLNAWESSTETETNEPVDDEPVDFGIQAPGHESAVVDPLERSDNSIRESQPTGVTGNDVATRIDTAVPEKKIQYSDYQDEPTAAAESNPQRVTEIVFIDSSASNYVSVVKDLQQYNSAGEFDDVLDGEFKYVLIDEYEDGLKKISDTLESHTDLTAIHVISLGSDGQVSLGSTVLNEQTVHHHGSELVRWSEHLSAGAQLLFQGSNLLQSDSGSRLIDAVSMLCDCEVVANDDVISEPDNDSDQAYISSVDEAEILSPAKLNSDGAGLSTIVSADTTSVSSAIEASINNDDVDDVFLKDIASQDVIIEVEPAVEQARQLIIIDARVDDSEALLQDVINNANSGTDFETIRLVEGDDGIEKITSALSAQPDQKYDAVHIVAHGSDAELQLGSTQLNSGNLQQYNNVLSSWSSGLSLDADILLYGCDVAQTDKGQEFVNQISHLTGADIASSSDLTGHADLGGNWEFEYIVGAVETDLAFSVKAQHNWMDTLGTITVTTLADVDDGATTSIDDLIANPGADGEISLREAVIASNADTSTHDTIVLGTGIHTLSIAGGGDKTGDLDINGPLEVIGEADGSTTVDATGIDDRVFQIRDQVALSNITIQGGETGSGGGGAIIDAGARLEIENVVVTGNTASQGGGLRNLGTLEATNSTIAGNTVTTSGGGISSSGDSHFNTVTISGNHSDGNGGGVQAIAGGNNIFENVTVSGNTATSGAGFYVNVADVSLDHSTVTDNSGSSGSGVFLTSGSTITVSNSIIAGNSAANTNPVEIRGSIQSGGNNIIGDDPGDAAGVSGEVGSDLLDQTGLFLGPLADNGGPVQTHALLPGSVGINPGGQNVGAIVAHPYANLLLSTSQTASGVGDNSAAFSSQDVVEVSGTDFELEPTAGVTNGTFNSFTNFDPHNFNSGDIDGFHHVSITQHIDGTDLQQGDVLFSTSGIASLSTANDTITALKEDIYLFHPVAPGDFSNGTFALYAASSDIGANISGFTLVEKQTTIGDRTVNVGDVLFGSIATNHVHHYDVQTKASTILIDGNDLGLATSNDFTAIELIEETAVIAGVTFEAGQLLLSNIAGDTQNGVTIGADDVYRLNVATTGSGTTSGASDIVFEGSDVGFDLTQSINSLALNTASTVTVDNINDQPVFTGLDNNPNYVEGESPVVLDSNVTVFDQELSAVDNFAGSTIYIGRAGAESAEDTFSETGLLGPLIDNGNVEYNGVTLGTVIRNSGGELLLYFNTSATNALVNSVLQSVAYANTSDTPDATVELNWTFNDNNTSGNQGSGGALLASANLLVDITPVNDLATTDLDTDNSSEVSGTDFLTNFAGSAVLIADSDATISDPDLSTIAGIDVTISNLLDGPDESLFVNTSAYTDINATYNPVNGSLTISGAGTVAEYEAILRIVEYNNSSITPDRTAREITVAVNDGGGLGAASTTYIQYALEVEENSANATIVGSVAAPGPAAPEDIVLDGQFSELPITGSFDTRNASEGIGDWDVTSNEAVVYNSPALFGWTPQGGRAVELGNAGGPGTIEQSLHTVAGQTYQVTFALTGDFNGANATNNLRVTAGTITDDFSVTEPAGWTELNPVWDFRTLAFTATGPTTTLSFESLDSGSSVHSIIGDVAVVEVPATIDLILNNDSSLTYNPASGKFYKFLELPSNYAVAQANAANELLNGIAGVLVTIDSAGENQFVASLIDAQGISDVHLGASDSAVEGEWRWTNDDDQFSDGAGANINGSFVSWKAGEPNNVGDEDFAGIFYDGAWLDGSATQQRSSIVEWNAREVLNSSTFNFTDNANGRFAIDNSTGVITVADGSQLDYESNTSHDVGVEITDAAGNTISQVVKIDIAAINEQPTFTDLDDTSLYVLDGPAVYLDADVEIFDDDLSSIDNFDGASLQIAASRGHTLGVNGVQLSSGQTITVSGVQIGTVETNLPGFPRITFNNNATNTLVNEMMQSITYEYTGTASPTSATQQWIFSDGGDQGAGGLLIALGTTQVTIIQQPLSLDFPSPSIDENSADDAVVGTVTVSGGLSNATDVASILASDSSLTYEAATGKFYKAVAGNFSWADANSAATAAQLNGTSGQLVTIRSQAENDFVQGLASSLANPDDVWIGASDKTTEGNWHWYQDGVQDNGELFYVGSTSGSSQPGYYTNWKNTDGILEPTGGNTDEDFARLTQVTGEWHDTMAAVSTNSYIVEWDAAEVLSSHTFNLADDANGRFAIDTITGDITVADGSQLDFETDITHNITVEVNEEPVFENLGPNVDYILGGSAVILDADITIVDPELTQADNFDSAQLQILRQGGANAFDQFSNTGLLGPLVEGADVVYDSRIIGSVDVASGGELLITFNSDASNAGVNGVMQSIAYANTSSSPANRVDLEWTFDDGNVLAQGTGAAQSTTGITSIGILQSYNPNALDVDENSINGTTVGLANPDTSQAVAALLSSDSLLVYSAVTGKFYKLVATPEQFSNALTSATAADLNGANGQLLTIRSAYENTLAVNIADGNQVWLGASDMTTEGDWHWLDGNADGDQFWSGTSAGSSVDGSYGNWDQSDPNNSTQPLATGEDTAALKINGEWFDWSDLPDHQLAYIIEWDEIAVADGSLLDHETSTSHDVTVKVDYGGGVVSSNVFTINVNNINDAPEVTGVTSPATLFIIAEDSSLTFSAATSNSITIEDADANGAELAITLQVTNGIVSLGGTSGLNGLTGDNTSAITFAATLANINAALDGLTYTTSPDFNGNDQLTINVDDQGNTGSGGAKTTSATIDITVTAVNDDPYNAGTLPGDAQVTEDVATTVDLSSISLMDSDDSGLPLTVRLTTATGGLINAASQAGIQVIDNGTGQVTLTGEQGALNAYFDSPANISYLHSTENIFGDNIDTIRIELSDNGNTGADGGGFVGFGFVNVDVAAVNDAPVAVNDLFNTDEDVALTASVLGNDSDTEGDTLTVNTATVLGPDNGTLDLNLNGSFVYTPAADFNGIDSFTYEINDGKGGTDTATVTVTIDSVNDAPVGTDNVITISEDTEYIFQRTDFGFSDIDGDTLRRVFIDQLPDNGQLQFNGSPFAVGNFLGVFDIDNGSFTYQPDPHANGSDSFSFSVADDGGTANGGVDRDQSPRILVFNVEPINDSPTNAPVILAPVVEDSARIISQSDLLANAVDIDNALLTATNLQVETGQGLLTDNEDGTWIFTPAIDDDSNVSFSYTVSDGIATAAGSATLDITPVNDAPVFENNTGAIISVGDTLTLTPAMLQEGDPDNDGTDLSYSVVTAPSQGYLALSSDTSTVITNFTQEDIDSGQVIYVHDGTSTGNDSFELELTDDGTDGSTPVTDTFSIIVTGALPDSYTTDENTPLTIPSATGLLSNDAAGVAGTPSPFIETSDDSSTIGNVAVNADGSFTYDPDGQFQTLANGENATDTFTYTYNDGSGNTEIVLVTITVNGVNNLPLLTANNFAFVEDESQVLTTSMIAASDIETTDTDLTFALSNVNNGQFALASDPLVAINSFSQAQLAANQILFAHNGTELAPSFDIAVSDDTASSASVAGNINFTNVNDDPSNSGTLPANATALEDAQTLIDISAITIADADINTGNLSLSINTTGGALQASGTTGLAVSGNNTGNLLLSGSLASINSWLDTATALSYTGATNVNANGNISPTDTLSFAISDNGNTGISGGATISVGSIDVDIISVNDSPTGADSTVTIIEDTDFTFALTDFGFTDASDGNSFLAVAIDTLPSNGQLLLNSSAVPDAETISATAIAAGELIFRPAVNDHGTGYASLAFRVQDDGGTANGGSNIDATANTITFDVAPLNDAPFGADGDIQTAEDTAYTLSRSDFGFSDARDAGDQLSAVQIDVLPAAGQLQLNGTILEAGDRVTAGQIDSGQFSYTPGADRFGIDDASFKFRVIDDNSQPAISLASNRLSVTIDPVSDAPEGLDSTQIALEDTAYVITVADFGFTDLSDGDALIGVLVEESPSAGTLTLNEIPVSAGDFITVSEVNAELLQYVAAPDANGTSYDELGFRTVDSGTDGPANTDTTVRKIIFDVLGVNDAPSGESITITTVEATEYVFSQNDFGFNDVADGNTLSFITVTTTPDIGTLFHQGVTVNVGDTINGASLDAGELVFQPTPNVSGPVLNAGNPAQNRFGFTVTDNGGVARGGENTSNIEHFITFDLPEVNDPPMLVANSATVPEGGTVVIDSTLLGGVDPDDIGLDELVLTVTTVPLHGQLLLNGEVVTPGTSLTLETIASGSLSYVHDESETSADGFNVSLADGGEDGALPSEGRFELAITEVIDAAVELNPDMLQVSHGKSFDSSQGHTLASGFSSLSNGGLIGNTTWQVELETPPSQGSVELHPDGTFTYDHNGSQVLVDEFSYRVTNEDGVFTIATVGVTIDPPLAPALEENPADSTVIFAQPLAEEVDVTVNREVAEEDVVQVTGEQATQENAPASVLTPQFLTSSVNENRNEDRNTATLSEVETRTAQEAGTLEPEFATAQSVSVKQHREQETATNNFKLQTVSTATYDLILDVSIPSPKEITSNPGFLKGLAQLDSDK